jgi:hypothetical protein
MITQSTLTSCRLRLATAVLVDRSWRFSRSSKKVGIAPDTSSAFILGNSCGFLRAMRVLKVNESSVKCFEHRRSWSFGIHSFFSDASLFTFIAHARLKVGSLGNVCQLKIESFFNSSWQLGAAHILGMLLGSRVRACALCSVLYGSWGQRGKGDNACTRPTVLWNVAAAAPTTLFITPIHVATVPHEGGALARKYNFSCFSPLFGPNYAWNKHLSQ